MPPTFRSATLAETIEAYVERLVLPASVQLAFSKESEETQWSQVPEDVSYEVYRIMQELLSNILKQIFSNLYSRKSRYEKYFFTA